MRKLCNGLDVTIDIPEEILKECIFIYCVRCWADKGERFERGKQLSYEEKKRLQERHAELFNAPLCAETFNGLCFSIGHDYHGQQMVSGWPAKAQLLSKRVDKRQNMTYESQASNFAKHNFERSTYPLIQKLAREYSVKKEWYDPSADLSESKRTENDFTGLNFIDVIAEDDGWDPGTLQSQWSYDEEADEKMSSEPVIR